MTTNYIMNFPLAIDSDNYGVGHREGYGYRDFNNGAGYGGRFFTGADTFFSSSYGYGFYNGMDNGSGIGVGAGALGGNGWGVRIKDRL